MASISSRETAYAEPIPLSTLVASRSRQRRASLRRMLLACGLIGIAVLVRVFVAGGNLPSPNSRFFAPGTIFLDFALLTIAFLWIVTIVFSPFSERMFGLDFQYPRSVELRAGKVIAYRPIGPLSGGLVSTCYWYWGDLRHGTENGFPEFLEARRCLILFAPMGLTTGGQRLACGLTEESAACWQRLLRDGGARQIPTPRLWHVDGLFALGIGTALAGSSAADVACGLFRWSADYCCASGLLMAGLFLGCVLVITRSTVFLQYRAFCIAVPTAIGIVFGWLLSPYGGAYRDNRLCAVVGGAIALALALGFMAASKAIVAPKEDRPNKMEELSKVRR